MANGGCLAAGGGQQPVTDYMGFPSTSGLMILQATEPRD